MNTIAYKNRIIDIAEQIWTEYLFDEGKKRNCVCWVGAGLSKINNDYVFGKKGSGYPIFVKVIEILKEKCNPEIGDEKDLFKIAEKCLKANEEVFFDTLSTIFSEMDDIVRLDNMYLLDLPFFGFVTVNFDPILLTLSRLKKNRKIQVYPNIDWFTFDDKSIAYIHGCAAINVKDLLLTHTKLSEEYEPESMVHDFLYPLFKTKNIVFLGCTLSEPQLDIIFNKSDEFNKKYKIPKRKKVILLSEKSKEKKALLDRLEKMEIKVIFFPIFAEDQQYQGITDIIKKLYEKDSADQINLINVGDLRNEERNID